MQWRVAELKPMSKNRVVSIIIPVINEENTIVKLIDDLLSWCEIQDEIIVADGGSTDDTLKLCEKVSVVHAQTGRANQMNEAAKYARGDVYWFIHADIRVSNISRSELFSEDDTKRWGFFDIDLQDDHWIFRIIESFMNFRSRVSKIATGDKGIFVARKTFEEIGGFPKIEIMEDIAISKTLKLHPPYISSHRIQVSTRRWRKHGILNTILLMWFLRIAGFCRVPAPSLARLYQKND